MFQFFDFIYYKISCWYMRAEDKSAEATASALVSMFQAFNLLTLGMILSLFWKIDFSLNKLFVLVLAILLMVFNYFRYEYRDNNFRKIGEKWNTLTITKMNSWTGCIIAYLVLSTILFIGLAIYLGSTRHSY